MMPVNAPLDSDALRANIAGTAQEVVIPNRYLPLLAAVDGYYGVREPLRETLGEYFHRFRNVGAVIDGLQTTLLRNWSYFERWNNRADLFSLLAELVLKLAEGPLTDDQSVHAAPATAAVVLRRAGWTARGRVPGSGRPDRPRLCRSFSPGVHCSSWSATRCCGTW